MNKNDLAAVVAGKSGLSKADAAKAVDAFIDSVVESLKQDRRLTIWDRDGPSWNRGEKGVDRGSA